MNNFNYGLSLLDLLYGVTLQEEDYQEIALIAWGLIGNKRTKIYRYQAHLKPCQDSFDLPCNADILEAVTADFEDFGHAALDSPSEKYGSFEVEQYIEHHKAFTEPLYARGKFINYERVGNTLYINRRHGGGPVNVLYRGQVLDDEGLPEITDKEATALATYCAYITKLKEGMSTNNTVMINLAQNLYSKWLIQCEQARTEWQTTQNDLDEILDAKTCWDRKQYNASLKLIR